jgi:ABC-type Zn uptake system ZnuABC Zn-binding protein ZnuA
VVELFEVILLVIKRLFFLRLVMPALLILPAILAACTPSPLDNEQTTPIKVVAVESFLADITHNVAGERVTVVSLIDAGMDPHTFEPTPRDIITISESRLLIVNGGGLENWLPKMIDLKSISIPVIEASSGITPRIPSSAELVDEPIDPHFWLDPVNVITYVRNIRDALIEMDPAGRSDYKRNADQYMVQLDDLNTWITSQVSLISPENRLLVTNHESFGYFTDRYGFKIIGTIIPSVSTGFTPTALQLTELIQKIKYAHVTAIFLEAGSNPELAQTIAAETGVTIVTGLLTHSLTGPDGPADTYINMMKYDTQLIVDALI